MRTTRVELVSSVRAIVISELTACQCASRALAHSNFNVARLCCSSLRLEFACHDTPGFLPSSNEVIQDTSCAYRIRIKTRAGCPTRECALARVHSVITSLWISCLRRVRE